LAVSTLLEHSPLQMVISLSQHFLIRYTVVSGFGGLEVACWPLVPMFAGSHPAKAVGFLGRKNPQHAFRRFHVIPLRHVKDP